MQKSKWEAIDSCTDRLLIPGGWIVRSWVPGTSVHQIFIEDADHFWEWDK